MKKDEQGFEDFLKEVAPEYQDFAKEINEFLCEMGYALKLKPAKNGYVASYEQSKTKRVILNFVFRKKGLVARIYGDNVNKYADFIETLPESMARTIAKAPDCKRLLNPADCNSRCPMGYDFKLGDSRHRKCRYNCFMFLVDEDSLQFIRSFAENEAKERASGSA